MNEQENSILPEYTAPPKNAGNLALVFFLIVILVAASLFVFRRFCEHRDMLVREQKLLPLINAAAQHHGLEPALVRALVWRESQFRQHAIGSKGEIGLMQLMPAATKDWARNKKCPQPHPRALHDAPTNLEIGCWYLARAQRQWQEYASCTVLQLAQYNAGRATVLKYWCPKEKSVVITPKDITYPTTREYIQSILNRRDKYRLEKHATISNSGKRADYP